MIGLYGFIPYICTTLWLTISLPAKDFTHIL